MDLYILAVEIARAVQHCHKRHIAHLDIKLENICVDDDLKVRLIDFGFAQKINWNGKLFGWTLGYESPEVYDRTNIHKYRRDAMDIWSVGIVLCVIWSNTFPWEDIIDYNKTYRRYSKEDKIGHLAMLGVPTSIANIIVQCTTHNPQERININQIVEQLEILIK